MGRLTEHQRGRIPHNLRRQQPNDGHRSARLEELFRRRNRLRITGLSRGIHVDFPRDQLRLHQRSGRRSRGSQHFGRQRGECFCHHHQPRRRYHGDHQQQRPAGLHQRQQQLQRHDGHRARHARCHGQRPERGQRSFRQRVERDRSRIDQRRQHQRGDAAHRCGGGRGGPRHHDQRRRHGHAHRGGDQRDRHRDLLGQHFDEYQCHVVGLECRCHDTLLGRIERGGIARQGWRRHGDARRVEHLHGRHHRARWDFESYRLRLRNDRRVCGQRQRLGHLRRWPGGKHCRPYRLLHRFLRQYGAGDRNQLGVDQFRLALCRVWRKHQFPRDIQRWPCNEHIRRHRLRLQFLRQHGAADWA